MSNYTNVDGDNGITLGASAAPSPVGSTTSSTSRDRSQSLNQHSTPPPSKKHRSSDDEEETNTATPAVPTDVMGTEGNVSSEDNGLANSEGEDSESPALFSSSSTTSKEDAFLMWIMQQKAAGVLPGQVLETLGLSIADGVAIDDDELWDAIMSMGFRLIQPSAPPREKLSHINTVQDVVQLLQTSKRIVVLAGAGISVSCGIPDFRSENGIYNRLGEYNLPNPQCMFDIEFFRTNPRPFFAFAKELFPKANGFTFVPSKSHYFLKLLEEKGKLLRVYSQNIDMLEQAAGISHDKCIQCHGSFATATCLHCKKLYSSEDIRDDVENQRVPMCQACQSEDGVIKPDIVFFGESLPKRFHDSIERDERNADLVLVMGSSLKVNPVRGIVSRIAPSTPMVLINREPVGRPHKFDVDLLGYSDDIVDELCRQLGWVLPRPDPTVLEQCGHPPQVEEKEKAPLTFELVPPSRHLYPGSKAESCSSSSEGENDEADSSSNDGDEVEGVNAAEHVDDNVAPSEENAEDDAMDSERAQGGDGNFESVD